MVITDDNPIVGKSRGTADLKTTVIGAAVCLAAWACFLPSCLRRSLWVFAWDSAPYIETANSLLAGRGAMQRAIFGLGPEIWEPIRNWPPGYPILVAAAEKLGLSPPMAAITVALLSSALFIALLTRFCLRRFQWPIAIPLVLVCVWMPPFLHISVSAQSDATYLLLMFSSLFCLQKWSRSSSGAPKWILAAGLFAGCAWVTRYAGLALVASTMAFLAMHLLWRRGRDVAVAALTWVAAAGLIATPLVIRNLHTFGRINPFQAAPSDVSMMTLLKANGTAVLRDLLTEDPTRWVSVKVVMLLVAFAFTFAVIMVVRNAKDRSLIAILSEWRLELLLLGYMVAHFALLIAARYTFTLTDGPAGGADRHFAQIYWIVWVLAALIATYLPWARGRLRLAGSTVLAAGLYVVAAVQARNAMRDIERTEVGPINALVDAPVTQLLQREVGSQQIVVSPRAYLLRIASDINARKIAGADQCPYQPCFTLPQLEAAGASGLLWGVVLNSLPDVRRGANGELMADMLASPEKFPTFSRVYRSDTYVVLKYVGAPRDSGLAKVAKPNADRR